MKRTNLQSVWTAGRQNFQLNFRYSRALFVFLGFTVTSSSRYRRLPVLRKVPNKAMHDGSLVSSY